jgi:hypothetical protein
MLPTKFQFIWPSGFRGEDFKKSASQKQELPEATMLGNLLKKDQCFTIAWAVVIVCWGGSKLFSSLCQRQCELLPSLGVRRLSSVNFSHFNLLL